MLDATGGKVCQAIDLSQSCNDSHAYYLSGKSNPINNSKNECHCRAASCPLATSEISLIAQEDLFYMDKAVTDIELPQLSVSAKASPAVKDICIDEGVQMFEKILVEYDKVDPDIFSCSNFPRVNGNGALSEDKTRDNENSEDLKPLSTNEGLVSLEKTIDTTAKNDLRSFLVTGYPVEQCYCSSSVGERRPSDTTGLTACTLPSKEIIDQRSIFLEESSTDVSRADSSGHNNRNSEKQDPRQKVDQVAEEEEDLTAMAAHSTEKAAESKLIARTVSSNKDLFEEDETSEFIVTSNDTESNRIDDTNGASDDLKIDAVASTSHLEAGDFSIVGNGNRVVNNQQTVQSQNGAETEEPASDDTISARSSFSHLAHGDSNLLGPASFSGSIISTHMPYSGNISLRSESSTTSGQSFAFPVLQPEWSNSPVRMAKAERRHLRKHRWKTALTCCKF